MKQLRKIFLAGALLFATTAPAFAQTRNGFDLTGALVPAEQIEPGGRPKDGIPSIDRPTFVAARDARFLQGNDRVLGVTRNGIAKAYPVRILNWHEIVNDTFGAEHIAVTFCPLCGTGVAYVAAAGGNPLSFGVSGLLYNSDVLVYDRQTQSLWSQILAQAARITLAIGAFVMQKHGVADEVGQRVPGQHGQTDIGMGLDDRIFSVGQAIRLAQDRIGHAHFSQVVQDPPQADSGSCGIA